MARIGINTLFLIPNQVGGTEYHLRSFLQALEKEDRENEYRVFCNLENYDTFTFQNPRWQKIRCSVWASNRFWRVVYEQTVLPLKVLKERCRILHSFGYFGPIFASAKHVITLHDANWRDHPEDNSFLTNFLLRLFIELNLKTVKAVVTDSEFSQDRLLFHFPNLRNKLWVIPAAVESAFLKRLDQSKKPLISAPYILCVSAFYPHKRIPFLLELWGNLAKHVPEMEFVLVGKNGKDEDLVRQKAQQLPRTTVLSKISFAKLVSLYKHASLFVFPSTYEGFGFPVYEALAAGIPVFVANKKLYTAEARKHLHELAVRPSEAAQQLKAFLLQKQPRRSPITFTTYQQAAHELLNLYNQL